MGRIIYKVGYKQGRSAGPAPRPKLRLEHKWNIQHVGIRENAKIKKIIGQIRQMTYKSKGWLDRLDTKSLKYTSMIILLIKYQNMMN